MSHVVSPIRETLVSGGKSYHDVTNDICKQVEGEPTKEWKIAFGVSCLVFAYGAFCLGYTWWQGIGVWG
jgi:molybdopterin-containing oxidoreductase family membrane subunit